MAWADPLWLENLDYAARLDRALIHAAWSEGVVTGLKVTPNMNGADMSVDVAAGSAVIDGDDQTAQGSYLAENDDRVNIAVAAAPGSNSRIDVVVVRVRDTQAGGPGGAVADAYIITGTSGVSPVAPDVPATAIPLAWLTVTSATAAITTAEITDKRHAALPRHLHVSDTEPVDPIDGMLWLRPA
jgi:hypothetical protein